VPRSTPNTATSFSPSRNASSGTITENAAWFPRWKVGATARVTPFTATASVRISPAVTP
jgi:hypothetical protein